MYGREHEEPPILASGKPSPMCASCRRRNTARERERCDATHPERRRYTCGTCGGEGHNARACTEQAPR